MRPRIAVLSSGINGGLAYQRGHLVFRQLRNKYNFVPLDIEDARHSDLLYFDAVIMMHPYFQPHAMMIHRAKFHYNIPVIVDIDDLVTNLPSDHPEFQAFKSNAVDQILMLADHVVTSTEYLANTWGHLNKNMTVIENCIDPARYQNLSQPGSAKPYHSGFVVGWTGGQTHKPDLLYSNLGTKFLDGLIEFMNKYSDVRAYFHLLCPQPLVDLFGSRVIFNESPVDYMDWPSMCYTYPFDVCCVPLNDHPFNHAKSDLRLLDMAPFGIPVIASPRHDFVKHADRSLMLYASDGDWFQTLEDAYKHRNVLRSTADRAKEYVLTERTVEKAAEKWSSVIWEALQRNPSKLTRFFGRGQSCK